MLLRRLQDLLAGIYDVPVDCDVRDFVTTDRGVLPEAVREGGTDEQLLVQPGRSELAMTLFLDAALLQRLEAADPLAALHGRNLGDFWTALEGVSHFVCVAWNARHDRDVSVLELEMQAEIDKYVTSCWLLRRQSPERFPSELHSLLFERTRVDPALAGERAGLYRAATRYAARFCRDVERRLRRDGGRGAALTVAEPVLRRFYRLPGRSKVEFIGQAG
ncbi:MAG: hypothetical protein IT481_06530 [Gammaproteobacteria bacterium]|nr:hypothetical protein [Gammaproteobacteria bacterium]